MHRLNESPMSFYTWDLSNHRFSIHGHPGTNPLQETMGQLQYLAS